MQGSPEQPHMQPSDKMSEKKKTWAWAIVVLMLLAIIVVGATLIGVYMTQKHIEEVVEMAFNAKSGEKVQQTVMLNREENLAAFYVNTNNMSSTILYDYNHEIIGFRRMDNQKCLVLDMNGVNIPSMHDILRVIKHFQKQNATSDSDLSYDLVEGLEADRTKLGVPINILCSDVPIYWATQNMSPHLRWKITLKFSIFGVDVSFTYHS
ncbi:surfactant protein C-like [Dendropsophus ebraccatus]|uniref:surfactant protein C-like n=1 Tax=Dendropsophus ebraccatus TaxID=150705 RepID=UPI003831ED4F